MEVFNFPLHVFEAKYPESSAIVKFGRGYSFAAKPKGPDQVDFTLHFDAMWFRFTNPTTLDLVKDPKINMGLLEAFYQRHRLYLPFIYPHDTKGNLTVRFSEPLSYKLVKDGRGQVEPFSLKLILQP